MSIDGSNTPTNSEDLELVDVGHGKSGLEENQFSYTLITEQNFRRLLFLEEYNGSIHDLNAVGPIISFLNKLKVKNIKFLLDMGYFSAKLMKSLLNQNHDFIMMAKECKKTRELIDTYFEEVKSFDKYIPEHDLNGYTVVRKLFDYYDKTVCYHLYFNQERYNIEEKILKENVALDCQTLTSMKGKIINENEREILSRFYELKLDENNTLIEFSYNKDKVMSTLKYKGFFVIITSFTTTAAQAYTEYHSRDYTKK